MNKIKSPAPTRSAENEMAKAITQMMETLATRYENQVYKKIPKKLEKEFKDSVNYSKHFLNLANSVIKSITNELNDAKIEKIVNKILGDVDKQNSSRLYEKASLVLGIDVKQLLIKENLKRNIDALKLETAQWIKTLRDDTLRDYTNKSLQAFSQGRSVEEVLKEFKGFEKLSKERAKFNAVNQVQNFNSITTKLRAQNLGIKKAIWKTSNDEAVRKSHKVRDGKEFKLNEGLYSSLDGKTILPGVDYRCRCTYELIVEE